MGTVRPSGWGSTPGCNFVKAPRPGAGRVVQASGWLIGLNQSIFLVFVLLVAPGGPFGFAKSPVI